MAEGSFCCFGIRDSAIPRTSSDQVHVLQDMLKVDYEREREREREREGNEDFVTKCNKTFLLSTCMPNVGALWMYGECVQWVVFVHGMMSKQQHQGYTMHGHFYGSFVVKLSISAAAGK